MANLHIRNFPDNLYKALSVVTKQKNRTIPEETIYLLKEALQIKHERITYRKSVFAKINKPDSADNKLELPNPIDFIREDRDR